MARKVAGKTKHRQTTRTKTTMAPTASKAKGAPMGASAEEPPPHISVLDGRMKPLIRSAFLKRQQ